MRRGPLSHWAFAKASDWRKMRAMGDIFDSMLQFFEADGWPLSVAQDDALKMTFKGEHGEWTCFAQAREEQKQMIFYSVCPITVPNDRRAMVAEFITRANYGMILGNFELDLSDGEVRYKTSIDANGEELVIPLVKPVVYSNVLMMDKYLPGLSAVAYGNVDPQTAILQIEGTGADDDDDEDDDEDNGTGGYDA